MFGRARSFACLLICLALSSAAVLAQTKSPASSPAKPARKAATPTDSTIDPGAVTNDVYRNKTLSLTCKIPPGWVLRTDELNAQSQQKEAEKQEEKKEAQNSPTPAAATSTGAKVLLAAFSRPPEARAEDVNSSILIAAESVSAYPGLTDAAQYFFPLTEVAKAQGFSPDEDPYDSAVGTKTLVRGDFHKNVGTRVMRQSTLAMLTHGYVISITVIAGTDDEVEDLIDSLDFAGNKTASGK